MRASLLLMRKVCEKRRKVRQNLFLPEFHRRSLVRWCREDQADQRIVSFAVEAGLAVASAILLILAFPGFEFAPVAYVAFVPLLFAIERENGAVARSFLLGWIFGTVFFIGTCWWLTFAPITYAGFPVALAYFLLLLVCMIVGLFPAMFAAIMAVLYRRFATPALFAAPFVWVFTEFLRYWLSNLECRGLFAGIWLDISGIAGVGGVSLVSWLVVMET